MLTGYLHGPRDDSLQEAVCRLRVERGAHRVSLARAGLAVGEDGHIEAGEELLDHVLDTGGGHFLLSHRVAVRVFEGE